MKGVVVLATIKSTIELVDKMSSQLSAIESNINSMKNTLKSVSDEQSAIDGFSWSTFLSNAEQAGEKMVSIGKKMTVAVTTPLILLGKKLYGTATDYESAFAGVKKTTEATEEEFAVLYDQLLQIAETNPTGFVEAAGIMEMAGQLGVAKEELAGFTEAYIGLQESTNINGEEGAADLARFLNVTEKSTANIDRIGGVIVGLGNNFATTENEILQMATRMGATADLAGFSATEILAFSAALSSVGIRAEAGGSAAGKLMKKMQLAAEVGGTAQEKLAAAGYNFDSGLDFVNALASMKKGDIADIADKMGMTVDAVKDLGDSWLSLEQFSEVMGMDKQGFLDSWDAGAAQSMLKFFQGLGNLDPESGNSILAQLAEMDITEIRLSNLVAAMAGNSAIFEAALTEAYKQYAADPNSNAMAEEVAKRYATQESQNAMLGNKLENSMADLGDNLVKALQPALDMVNNLLDAFNKLSEDDQSAIITAFMVFAAGGPIVTAVGATVEAIGKIGKGLTTIKTKLSGFLGSGGLTSLLSSPVTWGIVAGAGILLLIEYLDSIPTKFEEIAKGVQDIPITISQKDYDETMSKIAEVQAALNGLKPGEIKEEYENTVLATEMGYGTNDMYATSIAYEATKASASINDVASEYAQKMNEVQQEMINAASAGDTALADAKKAELEALRTTLNSELDAIKADYTSKLSSIFSGMASQYPEAASTLEQAIGDYDIMRLFAEASEISFYNDDGTYNQMADQQMEAYNKALAQAAWDKGFFADQFGGYSNFESFYSDFSQGYLGNVGLFMEEFQNQTMEELKNSLQTVSDNPILSSWLASMLSDPNITENMDVTQLSGALEGMFKLLDFKQAMDAAGDKPEEWGKYVSEGLGSGISGSQSVPVDAGSSMGTSTINAIKAALGVASPSTFMIEAGMNVDEGLAQGIGSGLGMVIAITTAVGTAVIAVSKGILSPGAGASIGRAFSAGLAAGISSGRSAVVAAAVSVATAAASAAKGALGIHSPSKETYWQGEMLIAGYVNAIKDGSSEMNKTVATVLEGTGIAWNNGVWDLISGFAATESQALQDEFNNVKDGVKVNDSDIKKIRSLAEREVINHFTTAEVKVEMNNTNTITSDTDIDSLIAKLEDKVTERLEAVAEGVYT